MSDPKREYEITLTVRGFTDRDPWEWAEGLAHYLAAEMNEANPPEWPRVTGTAIDVRRVESADV